MWGVGGSPSELQMCVCVCTRVIFYLASEYILYRWHHCGGSDHREWFFSKTKSSVKGDIEDPRGTIPDVVVYLKSTKQPVAVFEVSVLALF